MGVPNTPLLPYPHAAASPNSFDPPLIPHEFRHGPLALSVLALPGREPPLGLDADRIPFWCVLWDSAFGLARWIADRGDWQGVPVLELGCGTGLVGLAAAARGARVVQTDLFPEAARSARRNAQRNGLVAATRHLACDWRAWPLLPRWDLILASDILYERASHPALLELLDRATTPTARVLLGDPGRQMSLDFLELAESAGWEVEILPAPPHPNHPATWIYTLHRAPSTNG